MKSSLSILAVTLVACSSAEHPDGSAPAATTTIDLATESARPAPERPSATATATSAPVASAASSASAAPTGVAPPASPTTITVVEGTPQALPGGGTIAVAKVLYAHLKDDKNLSLCEVTITRNGKTQTQTIERQGPIQFVMIAGLRVGIESADPYHQPSSATLVFGP